MTPVRQRGPRRAPALLEGDEARLIPVRTTEIELRDPVAVRLLNRVPEEERHPAEIVPASVGAAVLVDHRLAVADREDARHGPPVLGRDADAGALSEALHHVLQPRPRRRRHAMALSCQAHQRVQMVDEALTAAGLVRESLAFGAANLALHAVAMEAAHERRRLGPDVEPVPGPLARRLEWRRGRRLGGAQLDVTPRRRPTALVQEPAKLVDVVGVLRERLTVIRERQRYEPRPGQPAAHGADVVYAIGSYP